MPLHDLHHVITGYGTDGISEGAIGAWEVASGCGHHWVAWFLNLNAMLLGSLLDWRAIWAAFVRGRRCRNYYAHARNIDAELLSTSLAAARRELLGAAGTLGVFAATKSDRAAFAGWWTAGLALVAQPRTLEHSPRAAVRRQRQRDDRWHRQILEGNSQQTRHRFRGEAQLPGIRMEDVSNLDFILSELLEVVEASVT